MKKLAPKIARYVLGLAFFVFGGAGLFNLFPAPPDMPAALQAFTNAITATGYFVPVLKSIEVLCGLLLLIGIAPPLMLVILAPISIHILLVHVFLTPGLQNLILPVIIIIAHVTAAMGYWHLYRPLFNRNIS